MRCAMELINALDDTLACIKRLSDLAAPIDSAGEAYFASAIELLGLIHREAAHAERLNAQLAACVRPMPRPVHGGVVVWP
jgi:hypothetical protein